MKLFSSNLFIFFLACAHHVSIPIVQETSDNIRLKKVIQDENQISLLTIPITLDYENLLISDPENEIIEEYLRGSLLNRMRELNYYKIIELDFERANKSRIQELFYTKTQLTPQIWNSFLIDNQKTVISKKNDLLLIVQYELLSNCEPQGVSDVEDKKINKKPVATLMTLNLDLIMNVTLLNLRTSQELSLQLNELHNSFPNQSSCSYFQQKKNLTHFFENSSRPLLQWIYLSTEEKKIPLYDQVSDVSKPLRKKVKKRLKAGIKLSKQKGGLSLLAAEQWQNALILSKSQSAHWNLAMYYWMIGKWRPVFQRMKVLESDPNFSFNSKQRKIMQYLSYLYNLTYTNN